ncbi:ArnT family glycosyltransferase [Ethanoligenens harbinense]|nr:glycosyltransferase family 39 protein [Ethanoligenens harbinense]
MQDMIVLPDKSSSSQLSRKWALLILAGIAALSFGLNFWSISSVGYGNAYYAAAIRSMTQNVHNFFFVAFDPAGVVSVDKPPIGLWVQAIFVLIFGYHGWAMLLPQALAGTGCSLMMYLLVAKRFGRPAGLISALVLALTPSVVVAARNNTMDLQLVFVLLAATWFLFRSIETGKARYFFLAALMVGIGFNVKMLEAYLAVPAMGIVFLIFSKQKIGKRILTAIVGIGIMLAVSLSWTVAVDLTPASERPYVGSSTNNTVWELITGHNGAERLFGQGGGTGGMGGPGGQNGGSTNNNNAGGQNGGMGGPGGQNGNATNNNNANGGNTNNNAGGQNGGTGGFGGPGGQNGNTANNNNANGGSTNNNAGGQNGGTGGRPGGTGGMSGNGNDIGTAGMFRLWGSTMYGQASWLIILALFGIAACASRSTWKKRNEKAAMILYWALWLGTMVGFFSFASFFHRYYLCILAPGIAGLAGIGLVQMFKAFRDRQGWKQWLLPASLAAMFVSETVYISGYPALRGWMIPLMAVLTGAALIGLFLPRILPRLRRANLIRLIATGCMLAAMLTGPLYWCLTVVWYPPINSTMPYAGPELATDTQTAGMTTNQENLTTADSGTKALETYLVAHYKAGSYLVVAARADDVAAFIVDTGLPAVAYGGFLGSDNGITLSELKKLVKEGKVTYFLLSDSSGAGMSSSSEITSYVKANATLVNASAYGSTSTSGSSSNGVSGASLYLFK